MTSEVDNLQTNEFLRRRKLRFQQVREQSKDIARKIRQRAKVEKLRQVVELDSKKQKEYLHRQGLLVKRLEEYYAQGIENVGASHKNAELQLQDDQGVKVDLSKKRGKEATVELRKKRQQILDEQKKLLDRKLQARNAANEISREKSTAVINKLQTKPGSKSTEDIPSNPSVSSSDKDNKTKHTNEIDKDVATTDMATQWNLEGVPNEWEPNIPTLALPKDDNSVKESNNNNVDSKSDKSKRLDLFALSDEMPSSLRGGLTNHEERGPTKSSLTLVSEYLQNRGLRLRESTTAHSSKKIEDLQSLKQTILRTRASTEGSMNLCHVHDEEMVPVPTWQAENNCEFCHHIDSLPNYYHNNITITSRMQFNEKYSATPFNTNLPTENFKSLYKDSKNFRSARPEHQVKHNKKVIPKKLARTELITKNYNFARPVHPDLLPSPVLRGTSPFRRNRDYPKSSKRNIDKGFKSNTESAMVPRKSSVTMYNHSTRDCRDVPYNDEKLVVRELQTEDDAYSQAMKESTVSQNEEKDHHKKIQEIRSKVAMTKQNVEKEYKDTISFLNTLPKDKGNKPIKTAFMDEQRQQLKKESRQQKLQQEYRKIEKECTKPSCKNKYHRKSKSRSPTQEGSDIFESTDFQYSWMPVPDSDSNLAVHTIPTTLKPGKSGNTVKFSKVDSYHEYRSRHKHTPPTKDTIQEKPKRKVEAVEIHNYSSDSDTVSSDSSSLRLEKKDKIVNDADKVSDAERIIIYKILDSKSDKKNKTTKLMENIAKSLTLIQKQNSTTDSGTKTKSNKTGSGYSGKSVNAENRVSFEELSEGVYKTVNDIGDNIASMYFHNREGDVPEITPDELKNYQPNAGNKINEGDKQHNATADQRLQERGDIPPSNTPRSRSSCSSDCKNVEKPSTTTSTSSFRNKTNEKASNALPDSGFIKLIDDGGQEAGKFYIGASGFLKDDAYEVIIQLRKKGDDKESSTDKTEGNLKKSEASNEKSENKDKKQQESPSMNEVSVVTIEGSINKTLEQNLDTNSNKIPSVTMVSTALDLPLDKKKMENSNVTPVVQIDLNPKPVVIDCNQPNDKVINTEPCNLSAKSASTTHQGLESRNAVPTTIPKSEHIPKPTTSIYTQTSMSSPNHRPVFLHMSSSTSTAYMSPPDMILPKYMRYNYQLTDEEIYDPISSEMDEVAGQRQYSDEHDDCKCRKCTRAGKVISNKLLHAPTHRCRKACPRSGSTPSNTAMSEKMYKLPDTKNKSKCNCRKCKNENLVSTNNTLGYSGQSPKHLAAKKSAQNFVLRLSSNGASSNKDRTKSTLKPVIKSYVDKLLVLNRESLKAVQVIDQDCSSVATPGSSIVDVPNNSNKHKPILEEKLSLQQIQSMLKQKILGNIDKSYQGTDNESSNQNSELCLTQIDKNKLPKLHRKKTAHKVKTLNISRNLSKAKKGRDMKQSQTKPISLPSSTKESPKEQVSCIPSKSKIRSKSSPTPRLLHNSETSDRSANSDSRSKQYNVAQFSFNCSEGKTKPTRYKEHKLEAGRISASSNRDTLVSTSTDIGRNPASFKRKDTQNPMSISTQTSINADSEVNFMKLAEDKLQNMEKIADLTEKCTQRLSNLAKVLEEVRKNKTLAYSQVSTSDTTSDSDQKSDKNVNKIVNNCHEPRSDFNKRSATISPLHNNTDTRTENDSSFNPKGYIPFLSNIPKPVNFKNLNSDLGTDSSSSSSKQSNSPSPVPENDDYALKHRAKPPPALSRIHLKHGQDFVIPHELSTVVEVDSPLSVKLKSSRNDTKLDVPDTPCRNGATQKDSRASSPVEIKNGDATNPDLLDSNTETLNQQRKIAATDSCDSKMQMIDIKQFNEIMLKPFFSLQEYAKQCNVVGLDDGSNLDDILKNDHINDELSSLHSEASLPDVISELLKRNIISEPFKFDTGSNANSTTVSSESTVSVLALSKARQSKKRPAVMFQNKENIGETSDTLSISSNPDLENAFKKLGMGWASSTLKKTKERLALSSSSNTSSSSLLQFKVKSFEQDIPALITDTVSSVLNIPKKPLQINAIDSSKNAQQQTSLTNSMTVKEFLTNELAKKITFNNKSRNNTEEEFVSLFETRIPEDMKHSSRVIREENSIDNSMRSGNNRARTSTPVQLFKSMTYHSSSSSNVSNGLFSNADDLSSVKVTSNSMKHSTSDKDDLIIPNLSLRMKRGSSECSKSD